VTGHFVWTLQKAENKTKVALDSGKVDRMTEEWVALENLEEDGIPGMTSVRVSGMTS
jgi:hypothetical protein